MNASQNRNEWNSRWFVVKIDSCCLVIKEMALEWQSIPTLLHPIGVQSLLIPVSWKIDTYLGLQRVLPWRRDDSDGFSLLQDLQCPQAADGDTTSTPTAQHPRPDSDTFHIPFWEVPFASNWVNCWFRVLCMDIVTRVVPHGDGAGSHSFFFCNSIIIIVYPTRIDNDTFRKMIINWKDYKNKSWHENYVKVEASLLTFLPKTWPVGCFQSAPCWFSSISKSPMALILILVTFPGRYAKAISDLS